MSTVSPSTLIHSLNWRYATKKFDAGKKIAPDVWAALEESLVLTPSSYGLQPWKFIVVNDPAVRAKLPAASWGQTQPVEASHFVVFAYRKDFAAKDVERFLARTVEVRGVTRASLDGYAKVIFGSVERGAEKGTLNTWMAHQSYIALGQFMGSAALLGIDTCPMEGIDAGKYDEILGLPAMGYATLCAAAAGYRSPDDKYATLPKVRFKAEEVILHV
jgi:nitroreductase